MHNDFWLIVDVRVDVPSAAEVRLVIIIIIIIAMMKTRSVFMAATHQESRQTLRSDKSEFRGEEATSDQSESELKVAAGTPWTEGLAALRRAIPLVRPAPPKRQRSSLLLVRGRQSLTND